MMRGVGRLSRRNARSPMFAEGSLPVMATIWTVEVGRQAVSLAAVLVTVPAAQLERGVDDARNDNHGERFSSMAGLMLAVLAGDNRGDVSRADAVQVQVLVHDRGRLAGDVDGRRNGGPPKVHRLDAPARPVSAGRPRQAVTAAQCTAPERTCGTAGCRHSAAPLLKREEDSAGRLPS